LSAFNVDQQTIISVEGILRKSPAFGDETSATPSEKGGVYFSAMPDSGQALLTVEFVTSVSGTDGDYYVDFGDKGIGWMEKGLTHTYSAGTYFAGLYKCTLRVSAKDCDRSEFIASKTITVTSSDTAALSATPTSGAAPLIVSFRGSGTALTQGAYISFGDGTNSHEGEVHISHTYSSIGTYTAELHKDGAKAEVVASQTITITGATAAADTVGTYVVRAEVSEPVVQTPVVLVPSCVLTSNKPIVRMGDMVVLTWTSSSATKSSDGLGGFEAASGSKTVRVNEPTIFSKTVYGPGGKAVCNAEVGVEGSTSQPATQVAARSMQGLAGLLFAYTTSIDETSDLMASAIAAPFSAAADSLSGIFFNLGIY
jgi:PKD repeat protein